MIRGKRKNSGNTRIQHDFPTSSVPVRSDKSLRSGSKGIVEDSLPKNDTLSVYTYYIVEGLLTDAAPTRIGTIFDQCRRGTADYLEKVNTKHRDEGEPEIKPYAPQLFNHCTKPVILKLSDAP